MIYHSFDDWKRAAAQHHYLINRTQGHEAYVALDDAEEVGRWSQGEGALKIHSVLHTRKPHEDDARRTRRGGERKSTRP
jgi:hypothetical protein